MHHLNFFLTRLHAIRGYGAKSEHKIMSSEFQVSNSKEVWNPPMPINRDHFLSSYPCISHLGSCIFLQSFWSWCKSNCTNPLYAQDGVRLVDGDAADAKFCDSVNLKTGHRFQFLSNKFFAFSGFCILYRTVNLHCSLECTFARKGCRWCCWCYWYCEKTWFGEFVKFILFGRLNFAWYVHHLPQLSVIGVNICDDLHRNSYTNTNIFCYGFTINITTVQHFYLKIYVCIHLE